MDFRHPEVAWSVRLYDESKHRFEVPRAPNWFHRLLQKWLLGIVWERL